MSAINSTRTNPFTNFVHDLSDLAALTTEASVILAGVQGVLTVRSYHERTVTVQMREGALLAWCEANSLTPTVDVSETDYTPYGGGFTTHRRCNAEVPNVPGGRVLLVSCEVVGTRPAVSPAPESEQDAAA